MRNYRVQTIASLGRGLDVLSTLQRLQSATLHELYVETGIPKPTLTRILYTAHQHGMVWQRLADGAFVPTHRSERCRAEVDPLWLVELASPVLERLVDKTGWPSVLGFPRSLWVEMIDTSSRRAQVDDVRFVASEPYQINILRSASGRAYLSYCPPDVRHRLLTAMAQEDRPGHALARNPGQVEAIIRGTRARGYSMRHPDFGGHYDLPRSEWDDGRASLAVPIRKGYAMASLNLTWRRNAMSKERAVARHVGHLQEAAAQIEELVLECSAQLCQAPAPREGRELDEVVGEGARSRG